MPIKPNDEPILRSLSDLSPLSAHDLAESLGWKIGRVKWHLARMHKAGTLHVAGWIRIIATGPQTPMYAIGRHTDAPRPRKIDRVEWSANRWRSIKADPVRLAAERERAKEIYHDRRKHDPAVIAARLAACAKWRAKQRGGPAPTKCPIPRPKAYRNIFEDQRTAA